MRHLLYCCVFFALLGAAVSGPQSFSGDRTGVTGFGARSRKKNAFYCHAADRTGTSSLRLQKQNPKEDENGAVSESIQRRKYQEVLTAEPKLWMQLTKDPDTLYLKAPGISKDEQKKNFNYIRISVTPDTGDWDAKILEDDYLPSSSWVPIEGIYGLYPVPSGFLWMVVTKSEPVFEAPELDGGKSWWQIRRVNNLEIIHLGRPRAFLPEEKIKEEVRQIKLLRRVIKQHDFYFTPPRQNGVTDMTKNLQRSLDASANNQQLPSRWWENDTSFPDSRFFWNEEPLSPILDRWKGSSNNSLVEDTDANKVILEHTIPVTSAFVGVQSNITAGNHSSFSYSQVLISRRSRFRTGTRFTKRGADSSGSVANYAETEQTALIVDKSTGYLDQVHSHVQTRGSIPLRWSSPTDVKTYRPRIRIGTDALAQARALRLHLIEQAKFYTSGKPHTTDPAKIEFVNLIDKHGDQGRLGKTFDAVLSAVLEVHNSTASSKSTSFLNTTEDPNLSIDAVSVGHTWYDFHAEVKNGKWNKLSDLLESQAQALNEHGHFHALAPKEGNTQWSVQRRQDGVIRTNCMDCLDRTNVVQSIFGRAILFDQLSAIAKDRKERREWKSFKKSFGDNPLSLPWADGEKRHRAVWADNADAISRLYAGTPALKGDFTRTGRRTKRGALDDGMNSLQRYYLNNFLDADRQEAMDLLVGFSAFSNVDHDDVEEELMETIKGKHLDISSVRETVRQSLWHSLYDTMAASPNDSDSDESQIDTKPAARRRRPLDLRWLPGDLQLHLRDLALSENSSDEMVSALEDIDRRSASDRPWWSPQPGEDSDFDTTDDEDDDEEYKAIRAQIAARKSLADKIQHSTVPPGYVIAVMVLGMKAPVALAASVVSLLWLLSLPSFFFDY